MAERTIVGVDFSGEGDDSTVGKTWKTKGLLQVKEGTMAIDEPRPISRAELKKSLECLPENAVGTLDVPYGVPQEFVSHWHDWLLKKGKISDHLTVLTMKDVWVLAGHTDPQEFRELVDQFAPGKVNTAREFLRVGDLSEASSCLHRVNPDMVPMTYHGMSLLHSLRGSLEANRLQIPPLNESKESSAVLLEVMPGAALRAFGLPFKGYKSKRPEALDRARKKRELILGQLEKKSGVSIPNLEKFRQLCLDNDDCLDSVIAAIVGALWAMGKRFCLPREEPICFSRWKTYKRKPSPSVISMTELDAAKLEGWIYIPHYPNEPPHRHPTYLRPNC